MRLNRWKQGVLRLAHGLILAPVVRHVNVDFSEGERLAFKLQYWVLELMHTTNLGLLIGA